MEILGSSRSYAIDSAAGLFPLRSITSQSFQQSKPDRQHRSGERPIAPPVLSSWIVQIVAAMRATGLATIHSVPATSSPCSAIADAGERGGLLASEISTPNHGAHRLWWWLSSSHVFRRLDLAEAGVSDSSLQRLIAGEVIPLDEIAIAIARTTEGEVLPQDWDAAPGPALTTPPAARAEGE